MPLKPTAVIQLPKDSAGRYTRYRALLLLQTAGNGRKLSSAVRISLNPVHPAYAFGPQCRKSGRLMCH